MPREKKFNFLPIRNEDLRKKYKDEEEKKPYVRIQRPGLLIFPKKTLEHFKLKEGEVVFLRFYLDIEKRAIAFKFIDRMKAEEMKETRTMTVVKHAAGTSQGLISIKSILNQLGEWEMPCRCDLDMYDDTDQYIQLGKMNYFVVPKPEKKDAKEEKSY